MAKPSTIIMHPRLAEINSALGTGEPVTEIARRFKVSQASLYRYRASHYAQASIAVAREAGTLGDYIAALAATLADVDAIRRAAMMRGDERAVLKAADTVRSLTVTLLDRLGIDSADAAQIATENEALAGAALTIARRDRQTGLSMIAALDDAGQHEIGREVLSYLDAQRGNGHD